MYKPEKYEQIFFLFEWVEIAAKKITKLFYTRSHAYTPGNGNETMLNEPNPKVERMSLNI